MNNPVGCRHGSNDICLPVDQRLAVYYFDRYIFSIHHTKALTILQLFGFKHAHVYVMLQNINQSVFLFGFQQIFYSVKLPGRRLLLLSPKCCGLHCRRRPALHLAERCCLSHPPANAFQQQFLVMRQLLCRPRSCRRSVCRRQEK